MAAETVQIEAVATHPQTLFETDHQIDLFCPRFDRALPSKVQNQEPEGLHQPLDTMEDKVYLAFTCKTKRLKFARELFFLPRGTMRKN
ncbi:hypothetical protein PAAG_07940 [Paracoccidioides lutzii Pb01]|uniref:Uncharacterized protein n=1 Tax=Paracoccidioides lutzii (strain ATCC MYA-826 / Pb01) TaxID=502779 RepID=C1HAW1_PARBA|nr:hypothetical protein PAAG_07940 [Paracoccidioides lutzii Pb01]EEH37522.2 hypothetical protein PAAG_07940 [Paracoccidioides lutzii Pb01]